MNWVALAGRRYELPGWQSIRKKTHSNLYQF